jgi:NDP-sugar pyrophosphorylase family protein
MVIIGAGGACIDTLSFFHAKNVMIFDDFKTGSVMGNVILGTTSDLIRMRPTDDIVNCIGSVGDSRVRNRMYEKIKKAGLRVRPLIMSSFIANNVIVGDNSLLNIGSQIHHDCIIGESCVISPSVTICGNVKLGNNCFVGVGTNIIQGVAIGENAVIGAGSLILKDVPPNKKVYGIWKG